MGKQFKIDDLVWAKMKGYPPWPGKIIYPPLKEKSKTKKNFHYVFFFGTENCAWVQDDCIQPHSEEVLKKYSQRKGGVFLKAVEWIVKMSHHESDEDSVKAQESDENDNKSESCSSSNSSEEKNESPLMAEGFSLPHFADDVYQKCDETLNFPSGAFLPDPRHLDCHSPPSQQNYNEHPNIPPFDFNESSFLEKKVVGFLGFNEIAQGIIKNLYHSDHSIILWHKSLSECKMFAEELKIKMANTPIDVVKAAPITFCCASDAEFSKEILDSILKGIELSKEKKGYIEMTPMEIDMHQMIAAEIRLKGAEYLEATWCGSRSDANNGTLFVTTAGDKTLYDKCKSCFDAISNHHIFVSADEGTASKYNHVFNMFMGTVTVALAESMSLADCIRRGEEFIEMLKFSGLNNSNLINRATAMAKRNYETDTPLKDVQQSFTSGLALGHENSQHTGVFAMANEVFKLSISKGYGDHDVSAVFEATKP